MNKKILYIYFSVVITCWFIINIIAKEYHSNIVAVVILIFNFINIFKYKNNKKIFFLSLVFFYFNYSVIISRYWISNSNLLESLYRQVSDNILGIAINLLGIFNFIVFLIFGSNKSNDDNCLDSMFTNTKANFILSIMFKIIIISVLVYHIANKIDYNTTIFEYLFIIFLFAFVISKNNKKDKMFFEILMIIASIYSLIVGERISVLQFLISDFLINYLEKFKVKEILLILIIGILFFTFIGVYGDILDSKTRSFSELTIRNVWDTFLDRRVALDTCVSAYFASCSMIAQSFKDTFSFKINNFIEYFTVYTFLGTRSGYVSLATIAQKSFISYGGGYITGYFYYWLGLFGVVLISIFVGILFRIMLNNKKNCTFNKIYGLYIISSIPRWYIYIPTLLFRGSLIFIVLYLIVKATNDIFSTKKTN